MDHGLIDLGQCGSVSGGNKNGVGVFGYALLNNIIFTGFIVLCEQVRLKTGDCLSCASMLKNNTKRDDSLSIEKENLPFEKLKTSYVEKKFNLLSFFFDQILF